MVNSSSFDAANNNAAGGDRSGAKQARSTQGHEAQTGSQSASPVTAVTATSCDSGSSHASADHSLSPCVVAAAIETSTQQTNSGDDTTTTVRDDSEMYDKSSLRCRVPLEKLQGVVSTHSASTTTLDRGKSKPKLLCLFCERSFGSANLRQKHVERVHSSKQNRRMSGRRQNQLSATPCIHCDKMSNTDHTLNDLFKHMVAEHPTKYFGCLPCEDRFITFLNLSDHNTLNHSDIKSESPPIELVIPTSESADSIPQKVTRSRLKPKLDDPLNLQNEAEFKKPADVKRKKTSTMKASKVVVKRSKRLQAQMKETESEKRRTSRRMQKNTEPEATNSTKLPDKSKPVSINPYPEFDHFYRIKKITDHSIDNLKISSLTFDDVFDKAFFNRIKCNIEDNLLHHIDGKLFKNEESESRISNFEKIGSQTVQSSSSENFGCELTLNAITPVAALCLNSQYGEDFESQIEYGSKPSKKKTTPVKKDEIHYKYFTRRKYQASILEQKENRDLSRLDMWTQLVIKERQQKIINDQKSAKEILEYTSGEEYKSKVKREELDRILDRRGPFEDLKEEISKKAAFDKLNSTSENAVSEEVFSVVRQIVNEIINKVLDSCEEEPITISTDKQHDDRLIPAFLNLRRTSSLPEEEIDKSDRIALICSSQETENFELPTNKVRAKDEAIELTGEWARSRIYICAACGDKFPSLKYLLEHKSAYHPNVWVQHYEFVGKQSELYRHLSIPGLGKMGVVEVEPLCKQWRRSEARTCTKCRKQCNSLGELHRHVLECGGDWTWILARKKCKYRPFGTKSRRKRRGLIAKIQRKEKTDSPETEKKIYKKTYYGPRSKPSDAETIQRMLANLPAKRSRRSFVSLRDVIFKSRKRNQNINTAPQSKEKSSDNNVLKKLKPNQRSLNLPSNRRTLRSLNKVLSSTILDSSLLRVKRKIKMANEQKTSRQKRSGNSFSAKEDSTVETPKSSKKAPKDTEPLIISNPNIQNKIVRKRILTSRMNIKSFFPVKKRGSRRNVYENTSVESEILANPISIRQSRNIASIEKIKETRQGGGLKGLVRNLRKKNKSPTEESATITSEIRPKLTRQQSRESISSDKSTGKSSKTTNAKSKSVKEKSISKAEDNVHQATPNISPKEKVLNKIKERRCVRKIKPLEDQSSQSKPKSKSLTKKFQTIINNVRNLKLDGNIRTSDSKSISLLNSESPVNAHAIFLEKGMLERVESSVTTKEMPASLEKKEEGVVRENFVPVATSLMDFKENPPVPEKFFNLEPSNVEQLQAKGELDFDKKVDPPNSNITLPLESATSNVSTTLSINVDTPEKSKNLISPSMVSPNVKGKIRKPSKGLNDCIAMLTSKLQQKLSPLPSDSAIDIDQSVEKNDEGTEPLTSAKLVVQSSKPECILRIPSFKVTVPLNESNEIALDLSKRSTENVTVVTTPDDKSVSFDPPKQLQLSEFGSTLNKVIGDVIEHKCKEVLSEKLTCHGWTSVNDIIQKVISNESKNLSKKSTGVVFPKNNVDDSIESVVKRFSLEHDILPFELETKIKKTSCKSSGKKKSSIVNDISSILPEITLTSLLQDSEAFLKPHQKTVSQRFQSPTEPVKQVLEISTLPCGLENDDELDIERLIPETKLQKIIPKLDDPQIKTDTILLETTTSSPTEDNVDKKLEESISSNVEKSKNIPGFENKTDGNSANNIVNSPKLINKSRNVILANEESASVLSDLDRKLISKIDGVVSKNTLLESVNVAPRSSRSKRGSKTNIETSSNPNSSVKKPLQSDIVDSLSNILSHLTRGRGRKSMKTLSSETSTACEVATKSSNSLTSDLKGLRLLRSRRRKNKILPEVCRNVEGDLTAAINCENLPDEISEDRTENILGGDPKNEKIVSTDTSLFEENNGLSDAEDELPLVKLAKSDIVEVSDVNKLTVDEVNSDTQAGTKEIVSKVDKEWQITEDKLIVEDLNCESVTSVQKTNVKRRNQFNATTFLRRSKKKVTEIFKNNKRKKSSRLSITVTGNLSDSPPEGQNSNMLDNSELLASSQSSGDKIGSEPLESSTPIPTNKTHTRRKSKTMKKIDKVDNELFKDFALVINKKTKRIPPTNIVDDSVFDENLVSLSKYSVRSKSVGQEDSLQEMDMELEDIPFDSAIIERDLNVDLSLNLIEQIVEESGLREENTNLGAKSSITKHLREIKVGLGEIPDDHSINLNEELCYTESALQQDRMLASQELSLPMQIDSENQRCLTQANSTELEKKESPPANCLRWESKSEFLTMCNDTPEQISEASNSRNTIKQLFADTDRKMGESTKPSLISEATVASNQPESAQANESEKESDLRATCRERKPEPIFKASSDDSLEATDKSKKTDEINRCSLNEEVIDSKIVLSLPKRRCRRADSDMQDLVDVNVPNEIAEGAESDKLDETFAVKDILNANAQVKQRGRKVKASHDQSFQSTHSKEKSPNMGRNIQENLLANSISSGSEEQHTNAQVKQRGRKVKASHDQSFQSTHSEEKSSNMGKNIQENLLANSISSGSEEQHTAKEMSEDVKLEVVGTRRTTRSRKAKTTRTGVSIRNPNEGEKEPNVAEENSSLGNLGVLEDSRADRDIDQSELKGRNAVSFPGIKSSNKDQSGSSNFNLPMKDGNQGEKIDILDTTIPQVKPKGRRSKVNRNKEVGLMTNVGVHLQVSNKYLNVFDSVPYVELSNSFPLSVDRKDSLEFDSIKTKSPETDKSIPKIELGKSTPTDNVPCNTALGEYKNSYAIFENSKDSQATSPVPPESNRRSRSSRNHGQCLSDTISNNTLPPIDQENSELSKGLIFPPKRRGRRPKIKEKPNEIISSKIAQGKLPKNNSVLLVEQLSPIKDVTYENESNIIGEAQFFGKGSDDSHVISSSNFTPQIKRRGLRAKTDEFENKKDVIKPLSDTFNIKDSQSCGIVIIEEPKSTRRSKMSESDVLSKLYRTDSSDILLNQTPPSLCESGLGDDSLLAGSRTLETEMCNKSEGVKQIRLSDQNFYSSNFLNSKSSEKEDKKEMEKESEEKGENAEADFNGARRDCFLRNDENVRVQRNLSEKNEKDNSNDNSELMYKNIFEEIEEKPSRTRSKAKAILAQLSNPSHVLKAQSKSQSVYDFEEDQSPVMTAEKGIDESIVDQPIYENVFNARQKASRTRSKFKVIAEVASVVDLMQDEASLALVQAKRPSRGSKRSKNNPAVEKVDSLNSALNPNSEGLASSENINQRCSTDENYVLPGISNGKSLFQKKKRKSKTKNYSAKEIMVNAPESSFLKTETVEKPSDPSLSGPTSNILELEKCNDLAKSNNQSTLLSYKESLGGISTEDSTFLTDENILLEKSTKGRKKSVRRLSKSPKKHNVLDDNGQMKCEENLKSDVSSNEISQVKSSSFSSKNKLDFDNYKESQSYNNSLLITREEISESDLDKQADAEVASLTCGNWNSLVQTDLDESRHSSLSDKAPSPVGARSPSLSPQLKNPGISKVIIDIVPVLNESSHIFDMIKEKPIITEKQLTTEEPRLSEISVKEEVSALPLEPKVPKLSMKELKKSKGLLLDDSDKTLSLNEKPVSVDLAKDVDDILLDKPNDIAAFEVQAKVPKSKNKHSNKKHKKNKVTKIRENVLRLFNSNADLDFDALKDSIAKITEPVMSNKRKSTDFVNEIEPLTEMLTSSYMDIAPVIDEIDKSLEMDDIYDFDDDSEFIKRDMLRNPVNNKIEPSRRTSRRMAKAKALENIHDEALAELLDEDNISELEIKNMEKAKCSRKSKTKTLVTELNDLLENDKAIHINIHRENLNQIEQGICNEKKTRGTNDSINDKAIHINTHRENQKQIEQGCCNEKKTRNTNDSILETNELQEKETTDKFEEVLGNSVLDAQTYSNSDVDLITANDTSVNSSSEKLTDSNPFQPFNTGSVKNVDLGKNTRLLNDQLCQESNSEETLWNRMFAVAKTQTEILKSPDKKIECCDVVPKVDDEDDMLNNLVKSSDILNSETDILDTLRAQEGNVKNRDLDLLVKVSAKKKPGRKTKKEKELDKSMAKELELIENNPDLVESLKENQLASLAQSDNQKIPIYEDKADNSNELRRSRRGSQKIISYNENDLIDPLIEAFERKCQSFHFKKDKIVETRSLDAFDSSKTTKLNKPLVVANAGTQYECVKTDLCDKIYEFTDSPENEEKIGETISDLRKKAKPQENSVDNNLNSNLPDTKLEKTDKFKTPISSVYCDICKKTFQRIENLIKHRTTLTHISKLSELEAKEAELRNKEKEIDDQRSSLQSSEGTDGINITVILDCDKKLVSNKDQTSFANNDTLQLADIINEVLNKPVIKPVENDKSKVDSYDSYNAENDSELETLKLKSKKNYSPTLTKTIAEKQISLLENIIEKTGGNLLGSIFETSNPSDSDEGTDDVSLYKDDTVSHQTSNTFAKPDQYEEISEDSTSLSTYDDQKARKILNRDEELFLECCSLLKSSSEVSNFSKLGKIQHSVQKRSDVIGPRQLVQPEEDAHEFCDNSRTPTPLGDTFDDNASGSNSKASEWNPQPFDKVDKNFTFKEALNGEPLLAVGSMNDANKSYKDTVIENRLDFGRSDNTIFPIENKKIITKGARKVFEGLKVSIPTEDLDLDIISHHKNEQNDKNYIESPGKLKGRKSKPTKKSQVGSNVLFKAKKKKCPTMNPENDDVYMFEEAQELSEVFIKPEFTTSQVEKEDNKNEKDIVTDSDVFDDSNGAEADLLSNASSYSLMSTKKPEPVEENITKKKSKVMSKIFKNAAKSRMGEIEAEMRDMPEIPEIDNIELVENYVLSCSQMTEREVSAPSSVRDDREPTPTLDETPKQSKMTEQEMDQLFDQLLGKKPEEKSRETKPKKVKSESIKKVDMKKVDVKNGEAKKRTQLKQKGRKRVRSDSETDDEFNLKRSKKRPGKKKEDNVINLEQEFRECIGVASRKSQRSCTSGKQNVLVEYWSSDDEAFEAMLQAQNNKKPSKPSRKTFTKEELLSKQIEKTLNNAPTKDSQDNSVDKSLEDKPIVKKKPGRKKKIANNYVDKQEEIPEKSDPNIESSTAVNRRKRVASNPLYHWSSSSEDDESQSMVAITSIREDEEEDRPIQHGWIVGDSPKKLVTMLALTKGKKTDVDSVKEQNKKRTSAPS